MQLKTDNREKLLDGVDKLNNQGNQVGRIKNTAVETYDLTRDANRELRDQREIITSANDKVQRTDASTNKTKVVVNAMTKKEYWYKFLLYITILLLFIGDIAALILKIAA